MHLVWLLRYWSGWRLWGRVGGCAGAFARLVAPGQLALGALAVVQAGLGAR